MGMKVMMMAFSNNFSRVVVEGRRSNAELADSADLRRFFPKVEVESVAMEVEPKSPQRLMLVVLGFLQCTKPSWRL